MKYLEINNLTSSYQNGKEIVCALDNLSLCIEKGTITGLVGPNGCGKSTLLKVIAGLQYYQEGELFLNGQSLEKIPVHKRNISYLSQSVVLFPHWTAFENIACPLKARKMPLYQISEKVEEIAKRFGIYDFLSRVPSQLSIGQQQKVLLAKCLVMDADLYLLDEPFSNIDEECKTDLISYILSEHNSRGLTILVVSHVLSEISSLSNTVLFMNEGKITTNIETEELKTSIESTVISIETEIQKKKE